MRWCSPLRGPSNSSCPLRNGSPALHHFLLPRHSRNRTGAAGVANVRVEGRIRHNTSRQDERGDLTRPIADQAWSDQVSTSNRPRLVVSVFFRTPLSLECRGSRSSLEPV